MHNTLMIVHNNEKTYIAEHSELFTLDLLYAPFAPDERLS